MDQRDRPEQIVTTAAAVRGAVVTAVSDYFRDDRSNGFVLGGFEARYIAARTLELILAGFDYEDRR
jgi:hypothetical protein